MPIAKCVITETGSSPPVHTYYPLSAIMKQQGTKKPDTLEVILPMQNKIDENYEISYIQDVVDTEYLRAVYPMQLSCLDEGGYNQDPTDPAESRFVKVDIDKFKGQYALQFTADGQGVSVPSAKTNKIDISKEFDINIWFTPDITQLRHGTKEPILWSFRDGDVFNSSKGIDIGITGTNGTSSSWKVYLRVFNGSTSTGYTGSSELIMNPLTSPTRNMPCHIRVKRDSGNLLKAFVNGVEDISTSVTQNLQPTNAPMVFGDTTTSTDDEYSGLIHEVKVYCGATLSDVDANRLRVTKPIVQYMKFNGRVTKITNKIAAKRVLAESNSYNITRAKLGNGYGNTLDSHALSSVAFKTIAQSAINNSSVTNGTFTVRALDTFSPQQEVYALAGNIWEIGSVVEFLGTLLLYSDCVMYFTPRKNVIIETETGHVTGTEKAASGELYPFIFDQNSTSKPYNITTSESNDTKIINQVILVGKGNITDQREFSPTDGVRRTLRRVVKQIDNANDLTELGYKILLESGYLNSNASDRGKAKDKFVIKSSAPIHHIRFNHVVGVKRKNGNNSKISGVTNNDLNVELIVQQVKWNYPSGVTTINVGEYDIDFFDDIIKVGKSTDNLTDTTL
tara:strand:+ start:661 stop:2523 length:1863 start_codon:yes stop_codon:yes gene_type:complete